MSTCGGNQGSRPSSGRCRSCWASGRRRRSSRRCCYARNGLDGSDASGPAPAWLADNARAALEFIADKPRKKHKLRVRDELAARRSACRHRRRDPERRHAVPGGLGHGRAAGARARRALAAAPHLQDRARQGRPPADAARRRRPELERRPPGKLHRRPPRPARRRPRSAISPRRYPISWARCASRWPTGAPCCSRCARRSSTWRRGRRACRPASCASRSHSCAGWRPATSRSSASRAYRLDGTPETGDAGAGGEGRASACCAIRPCRCCAAARELVDLTPEIRRFYFSPAPLIITKSNVVSRVHRRVHMDYIGIKTYRADGTLDGEVRIVGLFTSQAYTRLAARHPVPAPQGRDRAEDGGLSGRQPRRQGAACNVLETFPRDELFQIDVDAARGMERGHPRPRDAAARARVRPHRPFRPLRVACWCTCRATATPRTCASASARFLAGAYKGRIAAFYPYFTDGSAGAGAVHHRPLRGRHARRSTIAELERGIVDILRTWDDRLVDCARRARGRRASACSPSTAAPSRTATP